MRGARLALLVGCAASATAAMPAAAIQTEMMMRILTLAMLAFGAVAAAQPAQAQTYDPDYPICLQVYGRASYIECRYTSLGQCNATASGRSAQCVTNPYYANAYIDPTVRHHKRYRREY